MMIEIRKPMSEFKVSKWAFLAKILGDPFASITILFFLLLLVSESYYRTKLSTEAGTICVAGGYSFIGLLLLLGVIQTARKHMKRYTTKIPPSSEYFLILNDDGYERGVKDYWGESRKWSILTSGKEYKNSFFLDHGMSGVFIQKKDFKSAAELEEFRAFLMKTFPRR
jgi:hypothetical protein